MKKEDTKKFNICLDLTIADPGAKPAGGFQQCVNTRRGSQCIETSFENGTQNALYVPGWMDAAILAKNRLEELIEKDTVGAFDVLDTVKNGTTGAFYPNGSVIPYTTIRDRNFKVDDLLIVVTADVPETGFPAGAIAVTTLALHSTSGIGVTQLQLSPQFSLVCNVLLLDGRYEKYIEDGTIEGVIFHEYLHCLGMDPNYLRAKFPGNFAENVQDECLYDFFPVWNGTAAKKQWKKVGCKGDIPLAQNDNLFLGGPGALTQVHLERFCFPKDMFNAFKTEAIFSPISAGMLEDLGYSIDYDVTDPFTKSDLGGDACGDFCPAVSKSKCGNPPKKPKRRLNAAEGIPTKKGTPKNGRRKLNPANVPPFTPQTTIQEESTPGEAERDAFMRMVHSMNAGLGYLPEISINVLMRAMDGSFYGMSTTIGEADEYVETHPLSSDDANV